MKIDKDYCISSYLTFRYVAEPEIAWKEGILPEFPDESAQGKYIVENKEETISALKKIISEDIDFENKKIGILLSSGIDSAILAALLPKNVTAFTIKFDAESSIDESQRAAEFADYLGLDHQIVNVDWDFYKNNLSKLQMNKNSPLHPAELGLYKASLEAHEQGIDTLIVGNGADSTFGGMDKLLSKDWTFDEFVNRYTFLMPDKALKNPINMRHIYEPYRTSNGVDVQKFLKVVHGLGIIQMFENAIHFGGCEILAPFEFLKLKGELDIARIRGGEPKYILQSIFTDLFPDFQIPEKIPFARPMDIWLSGWTDIYREEFLENIDIENLSGEKKWQIYNLQSFLDTIGA